jgi:hypothetical protein
VTPRVCSALLALTTICVATCARAADGNYMYRGRGYVAEFTSVAPSCTGNFGSGVVTEVTVQGGFDVSRLQEPNPNAECHGAGCNVATSMTFFTIRVFDFCSDVLLLYAEGHTSQQSLAIDPNLNSATLHADVPTTESVSHSPVVVHIDLSWDGIGGRLYRSDNDNTVLHAPGFTMVTHTQGTHRGAVATGTLTIGGTNYTPSPSTRALLFSDGFRDVETTHDPSRARVASGGGTFSPTADARPTWGRFKQIYR